MKGVLLSVALASACASTSSATNTKGGTVAAGQSCASPMISAVAYRGTDVYASPDSSRGPMVRLTADTPVCASDAMSGYGFRRVTLSDGRTGYVTESNLSK